MSQPMKSPSFDAVCVRLDDGEEYFVGDEKVDV